MPPKIEDYKIADTLAESRSTLVRRGHRIESGEPVVLKTLKPGAFTQDELARFRREFEITSRLDLPGVVKAVALEDIAEGLTMVFKDIGGKSLDRILAQAPLSPTDSLELAIALADTVGLIHKERIIHKGINPSNIIFNPITKQINLIDFGFADELSERSVALKPPAVLESTLAYISPEQTGRMNCYVDYRTDFYSLGVTIYQMLTGKLPFKADDALGMVHCHIAKAPVAPHELDPGVPRMVSEIVMKLLAKIADDRYQSAWGLKADLEKCLSELSNEGVIQRFELGLEDFSGQLRIPQKLYGRQKEINQLFEAFSRTAAGERRLLLVAGYPGIGKTALVHEIHRLIAERRGNFIEGKFDQLQHNVPYFGWTQAFTGFVNYLLMESEEHLAEWKEKILSSVGGIGRILTDVIPNLELIIGSQPEVPALEAHEAQNRFNYVFLEFVGAIATSEHPLVVFLDDLQWIDPASLNLLQMLMSSVGCSNLLVIGAYRDNEVDALHPLSTAIEALDKQEAAIDLITLGNLSEQTVNEFISDILHHDRSETCPLTHLIYSRTGGNPFFLFQTLMTLTEKRAIAFDIESKRWKWKMPALKAMKITDNVVELMSKRVRKLPPATRQILQRAACIGARFNLAALSVIGEKSVDATLADLQTALDERLIIPSGSDFEFVHDRIQQAAYSLIAEKERKAIHWRIGKLLLREGAQRVREESFFDMVNHLDIGAQLFATRQEKEELAEMNLQAGRKAKVRAAFASALEYFETGLSLLGEQSWEDRYQLVLALHQEASEAACLCGRYERMKELAELTHRRAKSLLDEVHIYETEIRALTAQGELLPAIRHGLTALELLGMRLPEEPSASEVEEHMARTLDLLEELTIERLSDLPPMTSPEQLACTRIFSELGEPAYAASPQFFLVWASLMAELSLRYGNCVLSPFAYAAYALALCATGTHVETGSKLARAAIAMLEQVGARSLRCRLLNIYGCTIQPWTEHLRDTLATLQEAIDAGVESGDFTSGSYAAFNTCTAAFFLGEPLDLLVQRLQTNLKVIAGMKQTYIRNWVAFHLVTIQRLHGSTNRPNEPGTFDSERWLASAKESNDQCGLAYYYLSRLIDDYLLGESAPGLALAHLAEVKANQAGFQAAFAVPVYYFYGSLVLLKYHTGRSASLLDEIRENRGKLEELARLAPMNFQHKCDLISAEIARVEGKNWQAARFYEKAIVEAGKNGFLQEQALSCELAAIFYLESGMESTGQLYMRKAKEGFAQWKAWEKVRVLEAKYPHWVPPKAEPYPYQESNALDFGTVMKVTRAIASEMEMDRLLDAVMRIVIENTGAQRGCLLLEIEGEWVLAAKGEIDKTEVVLPQSVGMSESNAVPLGVVRFVARTNESVVLDDAANRGEFVNDPHIRSEKTKSLMCAPLLSRSRMVGILYLENNLATHAFTSDRVQLLQMLLSQTAISLENARVYEALRGSEARYRRIVDTANEGIVTIGPDSRITFVNAKAVEITGYRAEELMGRPFTEVLMEEDRSDHYEKMKNLEQGITANYERQFHRKDGRTGWALVSATPVLDDKHQFNGALGMFTDITERKQVETRLSEQLHFLQQLLDSIPIPIYYKNKEGLYLGCNGAFETFMGLPKKDIVGKTVNRVAPKERADKHHEADLKLLGNPGVLSYEISGTFTQGGHRDLIFNKATFIDANGRVAGTVGAVVDITERKQAERERLANLKLFENMDKVNRAIQGADDPEKMMKSLLDLVLSIFDCDRAFLVYPCDPEAQTWTIPVESTKPEYPGLWELNLQMPMDPKVAKTFRMLLAADGPVAFGPGTPHEQFGNAFEQFGFKSFMSMAIYPKTGSPWEFGIHQCAYAREWTQEEKRLLRAIGRRLADGLSILLSYRDLRNNEQFLDKIVEHIPNMISVKDAKTLKFVRFNSAGERLLGYTRGELLGKTVYDLLPKEMADFFAVGDRQVIDSGKFLDIPEGTILNKSNQTRFVHTQKMPILDENGTPQYVVGISEDITERRQAEESIRKLTEAIEQSPVSILITDVAGKIEFVNAKFTQITGYTYDDAMGRDPGILKSGETPNEVYRELWHTIRSGRIWQGEFRNRKKNGELFWENATIAPVRNADNVITHYVALKEDITERKKLEEQLRQAQKMEAVGRLAGGVAHDFNNMLGVILGYSELIISKLKPFDPILAPLKAVQSAASRSADLTRQLLAFSRKQTIAPRVLDLNEQTKTMERLLTRIIGEDIELVLMLSEGLWPVYMDSTQIDQLLANLAVNSRDAMPGGGKLTVETFNITLDKDYSETHLGFRPGDFVMLAVSDTGCGMDRETLDHVFEPFFTTKPEGEGTGLGLATVYGIAKQNEGYANIYSEPGRGTTVKIYLPRYSGTEKAVRTPVVEGRSLGGWETILLVEDEGAIREMAKTMLGRLGYTVLEARAPEEAIVLCEKHPAEIHLLLTDVVMPSMNGKELETKIRAIKPGIRTLFMSGYTANAIAHLGVLEKGVWLLQKPFTLAVLSKKVREALSAPP